MCGRFTLTTNDYSAVAEAFGADLVGAPEDYGAHESYRARYNIAPADLHPVVHCVRSDDDRNRVLTPGQWGLPRDEVNGLHINARSETAHTKPAFRDAAFAGRCIIPADGFYEWTGEKKDRLPTWFHPPNGRVIGFAGLASELIDPRTGEVTLRFAILTTRANGLVAPLHDRMPAIIERDASTRWLAPPPQDIHTWPAVWQALQRDLLAPAPDDALVAREVSNRVNRVDNDDPACLTEQRHPKQFALF